MSKTIESPVRQDLFQNTIDSAIKLETHLDEVSQSFGKVIKMSAQYADQTKRNAKGYRELVELEERSKKAYAAKLKVEEQLAKIRTAREKATAAAMKTEQEFNKALQQESKTRQENVKVLKEEMKAEAELNKVLQQEEKLKREKIKTSQMLRKEAEREAKITKQNGSAYYQLTKNIEKLTSEYRDIIAAERKETHQAKLLRQEILALNKVRDKSNEALGMHQNKVGQYERALRGLNNTMMQLGLSFGVFFILKDITGIISESEDAFASLSAITGLTGDDLEVFTAKLMEVATNVGVSGTTVAEAAEKIASAQPALLENADALAGVTEQAIILNKAIKGDLTETSMALVGVMNQFSLGAEHASRIINVLAAGSKAGAATVNQINESMVKFGTTAKLLNISVEESVGLIETLGEKAIFGADAGTALRNILLKMSSIDVLPKKAMKQLAAYGVDVNIVKDTTLSFEERLKELSKIAGDATAIMQIFGTENATAATVLLNSLDTYHNMTEAVTGSSVAIEQMEANQNTLTAVVAKLRASWENLVIKFSEGTNVAGGLKAVLNFVAENLELILTLVLKGVIAWGSYRLALLLVNKAGTGFLQVLAAMGKNIYYNIKGMLIMGTTTKTLAGTMKGLGAAMKSIPFAGWIAALVTLVPLVIEFAAGLFSSEKEVKELTLAQKALNHVAQETSKRMIEEEAKLMQVFDALKDTTYGTKERQDMLDYVNKKYNITLDNLKDERLFVEQLDMAYEQLIATMEKRIRQEVVMEDLTELIKQKLQLQKDLIVFQDMVDKEIATTNKTFQDNNVIFGPGEGRTPAERMLQMTQENIKAVNDAIAALKNDVEGGEFTLPVDFNTVVGGGGTGTGKTQKQINEEKLAALRKKNAADLLAMENELMQQGVAREIIDRKIYEARMVQYDGELQMITDLNIGQEEYNRTLNEALKLQEANAEAIKKIETDRKVKDPSIDPLKKAYEDMVKANELLEEQEKKALENRQRAIEAIKDSIDSANQMIREMIESNISALDKQIDKQQAMFDASKDRETQLRDIARERKLDASESIEAERENQKRALREIEKLEAKKRQLELMIAAMTLLSQGKSVADIKGSLTDIKNFVEGSFYEGTPTTVGAALGYNGKKDGHTVNVDDHEAILNPSQTHALGIGVNGRTTQDVVDDMTKGPLADSLRLHVQPNRIMRASVGMGADPETKRLLEKVARNTAPENQPRIDGWVNQAIGVMEWEYRDAKRKERKKYLLRSRKK